MKSTIESASSLYLPVEEDALRWGLHVADCGYTEIPPGKDYPPTQTPRPPGYSFSWEDGRTLQEYQLVYITRGRGVFESSATGRTRVETGKVFFLFPGTWHRYRPVKTVGWDENWIGFSGEVADRVMAAFFSPAKAMIEVGFDQELLQLIRSVSGLMTDAPPAYQQIAAARTMEVLALIRSRSMSLRPVNREAAQKVQQARQYLALHASESIDMNELARELGLSYSRFRSVFKEHTGAAPHHYLLDIRLNKARYLLSDSNLPIGEIADQLGFSSAYYFSRLFKSRMGYSPSAYRTQKTSHA